MHNAAMQHGGWIVNVGGKKNENKRMPFCTRLAC